MTQKKTLILPDIHLRWKVADEIIKRESPDEIVFLGDYFDDFGDCYRENLIMAEWLVASIGEPNRIHIMGNHDISYAIGSYSYKCSGWTSDKQDAIDTVMTEADWKKLQLYHWLDDNTVCSHAGIHSYFYKNFGKNVDFKLWLKKSCELALNRAFKKEDPDILLGVGCIRGGRQTFGGIDWCDSREFVGIDGINQIFGHTVSRTPHYIVNKNVNSKNLCLDTNSKHYAIFSGGETEIKAV